MTKEEAQNIANICIKYTNDERGNKLSDWSITTFLAKIKVELETIVNKDNPPPKEEDKEKGKKDKCGKS